MHTVLITFDLVDTTHGRSTDVDAELATAVAMVDRAAVV